MMKEQRITQSALLILILLLHLDAFFSMQHVDVVICLAVLAIVLWRRLWSLFHAALLFGMLSVAPLLSFFSSSTFATPVSYLIIFISVGIVYAAPATRKTLSWMTFGTPDTLSWMLVFFTSLFSAGALWLWASFSHHLGTGLHMAQGLTQHSKALVVVIGVPLFALLNASAEEIAFRGVLQSALMTDFRPFQVLALQAAAFAAIHFAAGFPNGVSGYFMVVVYGMMLGYLRQRSKGMLAPYLTHVMADLVIGYYLCFQVFD